MHGAAPNGLGGQTSPYLAAHAHDPVAWLPWGEEAFDRAREKDLPLFLSIGYASCHWCHVMQRESFQDEATAELLNERFVPVKVDRELRPDVDAFYMSYVVATTGSGGWPMSVFLTPGLEPFLGGTYWPRSSPDTRVPSFTDVLRTVDDTWRGDRGRTLEVSAEALAFLATQQRSDGPVELGRADLAAAARAVLESEDRVHGGFGSAPKFPQAPLITFLLAYHRIAADEDALNAAIHAVLSMCRGGTYDQAGGGIFRYSTDQRWLVPHFEKMLYDNALLLSNLGELYEIVEANEFVHLALETAEFLQRDTALAAGGFASSLDAEAGGVEGVPYAWTYGELEAVLDPRELELARQHLEVSEEGNWEGTNVMTRLDGRFGEPSEVDGILAKLLQARSTREQPAVIRNVLTEWNALAARGLIEAGAAMEETRLTDAGLATLDWLLEAAVEGDDVVHAVGDDSVADVRLLADHAAIVGACLAAVERTGRDDLLDRARGVHAAALSRFEQEDGLAMVGDATELPLRPFERDDSPTPSGAAVTAENAVRLARLTGDESLLRIVPTAQGQFARTVEVAPHMAGHALAVSAMLLGEREDAD